MRDRGARILAEKRAKAHAKKIEKEMNIVFEGKNPDEDPDPRRVGRRAHSPKSCSCPICGNPRKWGRGKSKLTRQEIREREAECEKD